MTPFGPDDWANRYQSGTTPWDLGRPHDELVRRLPELGPPGKALVPGAGRGHDAAALAAAGWSVTAIDFAPVLTDHLAQAVGPNGRVVIGDVLDFSPPSPVDLVFDHTFFCAIPPDRRPDFGRWVANAVRAGGRVASVVFPVDRPATEPSPPYPMTSSDFMTALGAAFTVETDEPASRSGRSWETRWIVLRRS